MKLVSHRGNINGPNPEMENDPRYVENTLAKGFSVEVDVWSSGSDVFLGGITQIDLSVIWFPYEDQR